MLNVNDQLVVNCTTTCKVWWLYGTGLYDIKTLSYIIYDSYNSFFDKEDGTLETSIAVVLY